MPSGAKKRKAAAKKKMKKEAHKNGAHHQGSDDPKSHDERDSDGGEFEREPSEEGTLENHEEGAKEVSLGEEIAAEIAEEFRSEEKVSDVAVEGEHGAGESLNGNASVEHKNSSSNSSEDEVTLEKEKTVVLESVDAEEQVESSPSEVVTSEETPELVENVSEVVEVVSTENPAPSEGVDSFTEESISVEESVVSSEIPAPSEGLGNSAEESISAEESVVSSEIPAPSEGFDNSAEESIPVEESVKEVVSLPPESNLVTESVPVENTIASESVETELKEKVEEVLIPSDEKDNISSAVTGLLEEKTETKVVEVVDTENVPEPVDVTTRENEALLPQSSNVTTVERNGVNDHAKELEQQKYAAEQPLVSSVPLPVRRTSWMNCCGLLEVFSGGSSR